MPSTLSWLDYSEQERRRALDVISLFKLQETRDELGLASIRDAFADRFFPGTSTIQTRVRYFLLVPWLCRTLEKQRVASNEAARRLRRLEERLIPALLQADDVEGIVGREAGKAVQRMPSSVFWAGLQRWGVLTFRGSLSQYQRSFDRFHDSVTRHRSMRDADDEPAPAPMNWHPHLPEPPDGFPDEASVTLEANEADYLRERIVSSCPGTLLAYLAERGETWDGADFAWFHELSPAFPDNISADLRHARLFSEVMHGAAWLYNVMLAEAQGHASRIETHRQAFDAWANETHAEMPRVAGWSLPDFWATVSAFGARITPPTRAFVTDWLERVRAVRHPKQLLSDRRALEMIRQREGHLKRDRARLWNRRHLELWGGESGTRQLDFRWNVSQGLLLEIIERLAPRRTPRSGHA
jgi:hypothetical protein